MKIVHFEIDPCIPVLISVDVYDIRTKSTIGAQTATSGFLTGSKCVAN